MSGQPTKTKSDVAKFRKAHMANLNLRAELDDINLQEDRKLLIQCLNLFLFPVVKGSLCLTLGLMRSMGLLVVSVIFSVSLA